MIQLNQQVCHRDIEDPSQGLAFEYEIRLYSLSPETKMVVISSIHSHPTFSDWVSDGGGVWDDVPHPSPIPHPIGKSNSTSFNKVNLMKMVSIANQTLKIFQINPSQMVWIEYAPSEDSAQSGSDFNLIKFDWQSGEARNPVRVPIYEDWHLSWLETV